MGFKVRVFEPRDEVGACNALVFASRPEAETYGHDLLMRWTLPERFTVEEVPEPANSRLDSDGRRHPVVG